MSPNIKGERRYFYDIIADLVQITKGTYISANFMNT